MVLAGAGAPAGASPGGPALAAAVAPGQDYAPDRSGVFRTHSWAGSSRRYILHSFRCLFQRDSRSFLPSTGGVHAPGTDVSPGRLGLRPGVQLFHHSPVILLPLMIIMVIQYLPVFRVGFPASPISYDIRPTVFVISGGLGRLGGPERSKVLKRVTGIRRSLPGCFHRPPPVPVKRSLIYTRYRNSVFL